MGHYPLRGSVPRVGSGDPNPEEVPPRHPNALPSYRLFVMPKGEINISELGSHYLTIGRIRKDAERFMVDADFIPPCTTMKSHPELQEYHAKFGNMFRSLENYSKIIIAKIHNRDNRGELGAHISLICRRCSAISPPCNSLIPIKGYTMLP